MKFRIYIKSREAIVLVVCVVCIFTVILSSCDDDFSSTITEENNYSNSENPSGGNDNPSITLPQPGNNGGINAEIIPSGDVRLSWTRATDTLTEQSKLLYRAFYSLKSNISTIEGAEALGTPAGDWVQDATSITITALEEGTQYYFNVVVATPDGRKAAYQMTSLLIPGRIYLYSASGTYDGNLARLSPSARATIDAYCAPSQSLSVIVVPSFSQYRAFISISESDAIKNFPSLYNVPANWKIVSFSGNIIAYNWSDLMDGSINMKLQDAGAVDTYWWSGSLSDGSFDTANNCNSWNSGTNTANGRTGAHNAIDDEWMSERARNCNNSLKLLCVGW